MTATLTAEIKFSDLTTAERKERIYYEIPVLFEKPGKRKKHKGKLKGASKGLLQIAVGNTVEEVDAKKVWIEEKDLRPPFVEGDRIRAIWLSPEWRKLNEQYQLATDETLIVHRTRPTTVAKRKNGTEIKIDPFGFKLLNPCIAKQEEELEEKNSKLNTPNPPIAFGTKVRRTKGTQTEEVGEVVEWDVMRNRLRIQWEDKKTWVTPENLAIAPVSENEDIPSDTNANAPIPLGAKVWRVQGPTEVGTVVGNSITGDVVVEWPSEADISYEPPKSLVVVKLKDTAETLEKRNEDSPTPPPIASENDRLDYKAKALKISEIKRDGGTQPREAIDEGTVKEYAEIYKDRGTNDALPPVTVFFDGSNYWLADGFHRIAAQEKADMLYTQATIKQGTQRDAQLYSLGANAEHGLRRTNADKRRAIELMLRDAEWQQWSDREIARHCKVDNKTVAKVRKDIHPFSPDDTTRTYNKNGKEHKMETQNIGKTTTAPQAEKAIAPDGGSPENLEVREEPEEEAIAPTPKPTPAPGKREAIERTRDEALERPEPPEPPVVSQNTKTGLSYGEAQALEYWNRISEIEYASSETKKAFRKILAKKLTNQ